MRKRNNRLKGPFVPRTIEMLCSPAFGALSLAGHRILARIEIEHAKHGGRDNGRLPVTFADFERFKVHRMAIAPGIREVCALGFAEVTRRGRAGNGEYRTPNLFRLTYLGAPTNEWSAIETAEQADKIARKARQKPKEKIQFTTPGKHTDTTPGIRTEHRPRNPYRYSKNSTKHRPRNPYHYLDIYPSRGDADPSPAVGVSPLAPSSTEPETQNTDASGGCIAARPLDRVANNRAGRTPANGGNHEHGNGKIQQGRNELRGLQFRPRLAPTRR
jgi:hypothetical protein